MARERGLFRRGDSRYWWVKAVLPNGRRVRQSTGTENREEAEALLAKLKAEAFRETHLGIKPRQHWQEAVVRYIALKENLRSIADVRRTFRKLDPYLGKLYLDQITGDVIWKVIEGELKKGNKPATVNQYLCVIRALLRMARDEWQWITAFPRIRLLRGEVERDRWLTRDEADRLLSVCPPSPRGAGPVCPRYRLQGG
jgi:integrase